MKIQESICVDVFYKRNKKKYYNIKLDNDLVVDFALYSSFVKDDVKIHLDDVQVFNNEGRYITLTDLETVKLYIEITNNINYDFKK